jgi:hypothetical protein
MKKFIKTLVKIAVICCIPVVLFKGCIYKMQKDIESGAVECGLCKQSTELVAANGEKLLFSDGAIVKRTGNGGFAECSCAMLISYQDKDEYIQEQINNMQDYWQKLPDCSLDDLYNYPQMAKNYASNVSFLLNEECYFHREYTDGQSINVLYNPTTKNLFYLYRAD